MSVTGHDPPQPRTLSEEEPVVVVLDGQRFVLRGPLAQLVTFVVQRAPLAHAADYSTWTFDLNAGTAKGKVELRWADLGYRRGEEG